MNVGMTITGARELEKMLVRLERKEAAKITRKETREAQKDVMLPSVKEKSTSMVRGLMGAKIARKLTVRAMTKMRRGSYGAKVIIREDDAFIHESKSGVRSWIPNAIEYGHAAPNNEGGVKVAQPIPFQRAAYEEKRRATAQRLAKALTREIEKAARFK